MGHIYDENNIMLDFIIVGTQKAGTSALAYYLSKQKDIIMSSLKELHYFDNDDYFKNEKVSYNPLAKYFPKRKKNHILYGEATPIYMYWDNSIERIYHYNSEVKLIAILRNPLERAFSHWNMEHLRGKDDRSFSECIQIEIEELNANKKTKDRVKSYVERGLYSHQIERMFSVFPKEQLLFIKYEDFLNEPLANLQLVFDFLGVSSESYTYEKKTLNKMEYATQITSDEKAILKSYYLKEILKVEKLLGWECNDWRT